MSDKKVPPPFNTHYDKRMKMGGRPEKKANKKQKAAIKRSNESNLKRAEDGSYVPRSYYYKSLGGEGRPKSRMERDSDGTLNKYYQPSIPKSVEHINRFQAAAKKKLARKAGPGV